MNIGTKVEFDIVYFDHPTETHQGEITKIFKNGKAAIKCVDVKTLYYNRKVIFAQKTFNVPICKLRLVGAPPQPRKGG